MVASAVIFNVQRFSLHDGPGIRTTVFFKGCPLRCRWCQNPESIAPHGELAFYADRCQHSLACVSACPLDALGAGAERVDRDRCDGCGSCVERCPHGALQRIGRSVTVAELLAVALRDQPFFGASGGGITLSGGEPMMQHGFVASFLEACEQAGASVGLQTCGAVPWRHLEPCLQRLAFVHFDLKVMSPSAHRRLVGRDNRTILANARRLVANGADVTFRMPVVPGVSDTDRNLDGLASFLHELAVTEIQLLPYHRLGQVKAERIGRPAWDGPLVDAATADLAVARAAAYLRQRGVEPLMDANHARPS